MKLFFLLNGLFIFNLGFSQRILESNLTPCKEPLGNTQFINQGIFSQLSHQDTLYLRIGFISNCSTKPKPEAVIKKDTLIINMEDTSKTHVYCHCYFYMNFTLSGISDSCKTIIVDSQVLKHQKSKYIDFPPNETIPKKLLKNKRDSKENRIGYWYQKDLAGFYYINYYGDGSTFNNNPVWRKLYSNKHELISLDLFMNEKDHINFGKKQYERIMNEIASEEQTTK